MVNQKKSQRHHFIYTSISTSELFIYGVMVINAKSHYPRILLSGSLLNSFRVLSVWICVLLIPKSEHSPVRADS